jgi:cell division protein FtsL
MLQPYILTTKKVATYYLLLAAVLITAVAVVAVPFQQAIAQPQDTRFLIRLVQGTAQTGLVNVSVNLGGVIVNDVIDVNRNNIAIPITIPVAANVGVVAQVCAEIISSGDDVCEQVSDLEQNARNRVTLDLSQAQ